MTGQSNGTDFCSGDDFDRLLAACNDGLWEGAQDIWRSAFSQEDRLHPAYDALIARLDASAFQAVLGATPSTLVQSEAARLFAAHEFEGARRLVRHFCLGRIERLEPVYAIGVRSSFMLESLTGVEKERQLVIGSQGEAVWLTLCFHLPPNLLSIEEVIAVLRGLRDGGPRHRLEGFVTKCLFMANEDIDRVLQAFDFSDLGLSASIAVQMARSRIKDYAIMRSGIPAQRQEIALRHSRLEFQNAAMAIGLVHSEATLHAHLKPSFEQLAVLNAAARESLVHSASCCWDARRIVTSLKKRIQAAAPTSLLRLGDGEGRFLPYPDDIAEFRAADRTETQSIWWGPLCYSAEGAAEAEGLLKEAIRNADFLGIPPLHRCVHSMGRAPVVHTPNYRGLRAILEWLSHGQDRNGSQARSSGGAVTAERPHVDLSNTVLVSSHVHSDMFYWDLLGELLSGVTEVALVSCHDLTDVFRTSFGIAVHHIEIPAEYKYRDAFGNASVHEAPAATHDRVREKLLQAGCTVNLIAAGFIGKLLCDDVKRAGGIAIDIGSVADYLAGYPSRLELLQTFNKDGTDKVGGSS